MLDGSGWGGEGKGVESEHVTRNSPLTISEYDTSFLLWQDKLGRLLSAQTAKLSEAITAASQKVLNANTKYAVDHLKGFEQEGKYAAATIQQAQQQLQQVEAAVLAVRCEDPALCSDICRNIYGICPVPDND